MRGKGALKHLKKKYFWLVNLNVSEMQDINTSVLMRFKNSITVVGALVEASENSSNMGNG